MKAIVLLNSGAGTWLLQQGQRLDQLVRAKLTSLGVEADVRSIAGSRLIDEAQAAIKSDIDVLVVGGGDGTLSTIAGILAGTRIPLGILPLGTLNHFAKDLCIPLDLQRACEVIGACNIAAIDVGEVNGHVFINNSSLGLYPRMVRDRDAEQRRTGKGKWAAMLWAMMKTFRRFPLLTVRLTTDTHTAVRKSPLVFVGNNCYQLDLFNIGSRACLNRGELSLYVANAQTRWGIIKLTFRAMLGWLQQSRDFDTYCLSNCLIETRRGKLHVALDGEVIQLQPPLKYRVRPASLRVCVPAAVTELLGNSTPVADQ